LPRQGRKLPFGLSLLASRPIHENPTGYILAKPAVLVKELWSLHPQPCFEAIQIGIERGVSVLDAARQWAARRSAKVVWLRQC
jgi:hypothetical protein